MKDYFLVLAPTFLVHILLTTTIVFLLLMAISKLRGIHFDTATWKLAFLIGPAVSIFFSMDFIVKNYQAQVLASRLAPAVESMPQQLDPRAALAAKSDFLKAVDYLANNPDQISVQSKTKLYEQFQMLFPNGLTDVKEYHSQVKQAFNCQLSLYEDALATFKAKKIVKSATSEQCDSLSGAFFNREHLLSEDVTKSNKDLQDSILNKSDKSKKVTEADLQNLVVVQKKKIDSLKSIFE